MNTTTTLLRSISVSSPSSVGRDLRAAVHSEWIKLRSIRATVIFVALSIVLGIGMAMILGNIVKDDPYDHLPFTIANTFLVSTWLTTLFAVVAGALVFTSEVQHGTLAGALTTRPSKSILVGAKVVVTAALGLAMGALGIVGALVGGLVSSMDTGDMSGAGSRIAWALVLTTLAAVLGLGVGLIVRHSSGAVTAVLVWALAIETVVHGVVPANASRFLPFTAAHGLLGTRAEADTPEILAAALSNIGNTVIIGGWAAVAVAIGTALMIRQDA